MTRPRPNNRATSSSPRKARRRCRGRRRNRRPRPPKRAPSPPPAPTRHRQRRALQPLLLMRLPTTRRSGRSDRPSSRHAKTKSTHSLALKRLARSAPRTDNERVVALRQWPPVVAKPVGDGVAAIAPEIAARHFDSGRGLPPLVFGNVEQPIDPRDHFAVETRRDDGCQRLLALDQPFKDRVHNFIRRQRILVGLVFRQLRRRG